MTIQFQVGQTYSGRFMSDYDSIANFTILARTAKTVKVAHHLGEQVEIVTRRVSEYRGVEQFKPFGTHSLNMIIGADYPDLRAIKAEG